MKRLLGNIISLTVLVLICLLVVSGISADSFGQLTYTPDGVVKPNSKRMRNISYALSLEDTSPNNWVVFFNRYHRNNPAKRYSSGLLPVDSEFYFPLQTVRLEDEPVARNAKTSTVSYAPLKLAFATILKPDLTLNKKRLQALQRYYAAQKLNFSAVEALNVRDGAFLPAFEINYVQDKPKFTQLIQTQLEAAKDILVANSLPYKDLILSAGYLDFDPTDDGFTRDLKKNQAIDTLGQKIYDAFKSYHQTFEADSTTNVRILLQNDIAPVKKKNRYFIGRHYKDLVALRARILLANQLSFPQIPDLDKRIGISIDSAKLVQAWDRHPKLFTYADANNVQTPAKSMDELVTALRQDLVLTDFIGQKQRLVQHVVLSYTPTKKERTMVEWVRLYGDRDKLAAQDERDKARAFWPDYDYGLYWPYTRAKKKRFLKQQLRLGAALVKMSDIGRANRGVIHFRFPRKENFPVLHALFRPVIQSKALAGYFVIKDDGAERSEQFKSMEWIHHYLYTAIP